MIRFLPVNSSIRIPCKASPGSAGFDIYSAEAVTIPVGKRALVDTGFSMAFEGNMYARIAPRSGLAVRGIDVGAGVIDSDYRGPVKVLIINNSQTDFVIQVGDRIAQMVFEAYVRDVSFQLVDNLDSTERGTGGFGSTGVRDENNASQKQKEQAKLFHIMNDMVELL
jgi:deoxyuridine 5'-triphosphate nucleotidohydrolase